MKLSNQTILIGMQPPSIQSILDENVRTFSYKQVCNPEEFVAWICKFVGTTWNGVFGVCLDRPACFDKSVEALKYTGGFDSHLSNTLHGGQAFKQHILKVVSQFIHQEYVIQHIGTFIQDLHQGSWKTKCEIIACLMGNYPPSSPMVSVKPEALVDDLVKILHQMSKASGITGKCSG